jgi:hypothetical protein
MKKIFVLLAGLSVYYNSINAKELKYKVADIPVELTHNAQSVVRKDITEFELKSPGNAVFKQTFAITVLNKNGLEDADFVKAYDKFSKISGISGKIYNEAGEIVKRISGDDIEDYSAISGYTTFDDNRVKHFETNYRTFPFTLEYSYEISYSGIFSYPNWTPFAGYHVATENSSVKVTVPSGLAIRYKEKNISEKVKISQEKDKQIYFWEVHNMKAMSSEPLRVPTSDIIPIVYFAPSDFKIQGIEGNLDSWKAFGQWISILNTGKNDLTEETKVEVRNLVKDAKTDYEKVRILYEYMQSRTRYVSIQIGIGGWQPFPASTVHRLSFGDCKALANYMKSLLEAVNIKADYLLVHAGDSFSDLMIDFPSSQFNHAFVCVPQPKDTLWLECTNQRMPCGYIGDFTDDRDVLLIDGDNSKIVHTKRYTAQENTESRLSIVKITSPGVGEALVKTNYKGLNYEQIEPIYYADDVDKKKKISNRINLPGFQLNSFSYKENKAVIPSFDETLKLDFFNYGTVSGQRVFMPLNFMNRFNNIPERVRNRKTEVLLRRTYTDIDTVIYELPYDYKVDQLPQAVELKTKFGTYNSKAELKDDKIVYTRYFERNKGKFPPEAYAELLEFYEKIASADGLQCCLIKK